MERSLSIEDALGIIEQKAALLRFMARCAPENPNDQADEPTFNGIGEVAGDIEQLAQVVRRSLPSEALIPTVKPEQGE